MATGFVAATLPVLPGCDTVLSTLDPAGPAGAAVARLWWVMLVAAVLLFTLVMGLLWFAWRGHLARTPARNWLAGGGLLLPGAVLTPLAIYAFVQGERLFAQPGRAELEVVAVGRMWQWEFAYPADAPGLRTLDTLHIPAGRTVDVMVQSEDVIHSFWVPRLAGKIDAIPGRTNRVRLVAVQPGTYAGVCAEFCGRLHAGMAFAVVAHPPEAFAAVLRAAEVRQ